MLMHPAQQVPARTTEALPLGHALRRLLSPALALALALTVGAWPAWASDPWIDNVRAFEPGPSAGFGAAELPRIVLGPPRGLGASQGSVDVVSLGNGGRITVSFDDNAVVDGEGDDLRRRVDDPDLEWLGEHVVAYPGAGSHSHSPNRTDELVSRSRATKTSKPVDADALPTSPAPLDPDDAAWEAA